MLNSIQKLTLEVFNTAKAYKYPAFEKDGKTIPEGIKCSFACLATDENGGKSVVEVVLRHVSEDYIVEKGKYVLEAPANFFRRRGSIYVIGFNPEKDERIVFGKSK